jgi:hypothetical protein
MGMSKTRRGRLRQVERWLNKYYPTPRPTFVRVIDFKRKRTEGGCYIWAETERMKNKIYIRIHSKLPWNIAVETLLHEWAHAVTWPLATVEHTVSHNTEWAVTYGKIYEDFYDRYGFIESREYPDS